MPGIRRFIAVLLTLCTMGSAWALDEFPVQATEASGRPGERVFLNLVFDYGPSFRLMAEDFKVEFPHESLAFSRDGTRIRIGGVDMGLPQYFQLLQSFGIPAENPAFQPPNPDRHGYQYAFFVASVPHVRQGQVLLRVALDILPSTRPGRYEVSVTGVQSDENAIVNNLECCDLPASLQSLGVTVLAVPEPGLALLLLPGLALVVLRARRMSART